MLVRQLVVCAITGAARLYLPLSSRVPGTQGVLMGGKRLISAGDSHQEAPITSLYGPLSATLLPF